MRVEAVALSFDLVPENGEKRGKGKGRHITLPRSYGQIHDPSGRDWPRTSILFGPVKRTNEPAPASIIDPSDIDYFGRDAELLRGEIEAPPRSLATWKLVGPVERIWYDRRGTRYPGPYEHLFKEKSWLFGRETPALLYERGEWTRLDFPAGCTISWRGFVAP